MTENTNHAERCAECGLGCAAGNCVYRAERAPSGDVNERQLVLDLCNIAVTFSGKSMLEVAIGRAVRQFLARRATAGNAAPALIQALEKGDERESDKWFDIQASEIALYEEEGYRVRKLYEVVAGNAAAPGELPPLPEKVTRKVDVGLCFVEVSGFNADQMREYGRSCLASNAGAAPAWQPIETAPRTGRTLLLGRFNELGNWRTMRGQWCSQETIDQEWEDPDSAEEGWYETAVEPDVPNCWAISPTHWMPLPAAPPPDTSPAGAERKA